MKWIKLYTKLGKQSMSVTNNQDVYAMLDMNDGLGVRKVYLDLKFDKSGHPYLTQSINQLNSRPEPTKEVQNQRPTEKIFNPYKALEFKISVGLKTDKLFYSVPELEYKTILIQADSRKEALERLHFLYEDKLYSYEILDVLPAP